VRQLRDNQLVWVADVRREEDIEGGAVLDLGEEVAAGAIGDGKLYASLFFVLGGQIGQRELEVGGGGKGGGWGAGEGGKKKKNEKNPPPQSAAATKASWIAV